jgi:hypothetical protein
MGCDAGDIDYLASRWVQGYRHRHTGTRTGTAGAVRDGWAKVPI